MGWSEHAGRATLAECRAVTFRAGTGGVGAVVGLGRRRNVCLYHDDQLGPCGGWSIAPGVYSTSNGFTEVTLAARGTIAQGADDGVAVLRVVVCGRCGGVRARALVDPLRLVLDGNRVVDPWGVLDDRRSTDRPT